MRSVRRQNCSDVGVLVAVVVFVAASAGAATAALEVGFYDWSCPEAMDLVKQGVHAAMQRDSRMPASLLRLHFHDCFVNGCDGSNLLDDRPGFVGEKTAPPNLNSARGFDVIDDIKQRLEEACPATVSCADIVAAAARDAVFLSGGPFFDVELGRLDALSTSLAAASNAIPKPNFTVPQLIASFKEVGLDEADVVSLSGSHTLGKARCTSFRSRLQWNSGASTAGARDAPALEPAYLAELQERCPESGDGNATTSLDPCTPARFDNQYYKNVMAGAGLLVSDAVLQSTGATAQLVALFASDEAAFFDAFALSMRKMGASRVIRDGRGEVRRNCRVPNAAI